MNKDTIIKVLLAIIALMVFAWLWRIISGMLIGTLVLTTSLLSVLIALIIQAEAGLERRTKRGCDCHDKGQAEYDR